MADDPTPTGPNPSGDDQPPIKPKTTLDKDLK